MRSRPLPFESMPGVAEADEGILENDYFLNEARVAGTQLRDIPRTLAQSG